MGLFKKFNTLSTRTESIFVRFQIILRCLELLMFIPNGPRIFSSACFSVYFLRILYFSFTAQKLAAHLLCNCWYGWLYHLSWVFTRGYACMSSPWLLGRESTSPPFDFQCGHMLWFVEWDINKCFASKSLKCTCVVRLVYLHSSLYHQKTKTLATCPRVRETRRKPLPSLELGAKPSLVQLYSNKHVDAWVKNICLFL